MKQISEVVVYTAEPKDNEYNFKVQPPFVFSTNLISGPNGTALRITDDDSTVVFFNWDRVVAVEVSPSEEVEE